MPINCPIPFNENGTCVGCRQNFDEECNHSILSAIPIEQILTDREYILYLDKKRGGEGYRGEGLLRGDFVKRGEFNYLMNKLNDHIDKAKKRDHAY